MSITYPITLRPGITFEESYRVSSGPTNNRVPVNLTGKTVRLRIYAAFGLEFILESGAQPGDFGAQLVVLDAPDGRFKILLTDEQTSRLLAQGSYRVEVSEPSGQIRFLFEGPINYKRLT